MNEMDTGVVAAAVCLLGLLFVWAWAVNGKHTYKDK